MSKVISKRKFVVCLFFIAVCFTLIFFTRVRHNVSRQFFDDSPPSSREDISAPDRNSELQNSRTEKETAQAISQLREVVFYNKLIEVNGKSTLHITTMEKPTKQNPYYLMKVSEYFPDHEVTFHWYRANIYGKYIEKKDTLYGDLWYLIDDANMIIGYSDANHVVDCLASLPQLEMDYCEKYNYVHANEVLALRVNAAGAINSDLNDLMQKDYKDWQEQTENKCTSERNTYTDGSIRHLIYYSCMNNAIKFKLGDLQEKYPINWTELSEKSQPELNGEGTCLSLRVYRVFDDKIYLFDPFPDNEKYYVSDIKPFTSVKESDDVNVCAKHIRVLDEPIIYAIGVKDYTVQIGNELSDVYKVEQRVK